MGRLVPSTFLTTAPSVVIPKLPAEPVAQADLPVRVPAA